MSNLKIKDLVSGQTVEMYLLVGSMENKETSTHKPYVEFMFEDGIGKISAKLWNTTTNDIPDIRVGDVAYFIVKVGEWNDSLQLIVQSCRALNLIDNINKDEFIKQSPISGEEMFDFIMKVVDDFSDTNLKKLTSTILINNKSKLLYFPGGKKVHHDIKAGLLFHTLRMLQSGMKIAEVYPGINNDLFFSGIILHDIGKVEELNSDECGKTEDYTDAGKMLGHLVQGIKIVAFTAKELNIPEETSLLIEHMIASHHGDETTGAIKKPMFIEAELLHHLDMIDSRAYIYNEVIKNTDINKFSEKQFFLGNIQVYNHN